MEERRLEDRRQDRRDEVLRALVEEHIRTGEPVSSRRILEVTGLAVSGATIRNELAVLDRDGYAVQPHTSAGRVPTARAYRYYVDHLSPSKLRSATQLRIADFFSTVHFELGRLLKATTELLTDITQYPAVALGPGPTGERIKAMHLVQMGAKTFLLVVVTESGRVSQELCRLEEAVTTAELDEAEQALTKTLVGGEVGSDAATPLADLELSPAARTAVDLALGALGRTATRTADIYVGGTRQMATVWDNLSTVHRVLEVLEREAMLLDVLARAHGTAIQLGGELVGDEDVDFAVVSSAFEAGLGEGRVGVIGPLRMDYRKVISAVEGVSRELAERIGP
jgi:heat-inducible transcriptional repressor